MTTHSQTFTSGGRGLGSGPRGTTLAVLLASGLVWGLVARDPIPAALLGVFLLLPREFALYRWIRRWPPALAYGALALTLLWPPIDLAAVSGHPGIAAGRLVALLAVWRFQFRRLALRDHVFLFALSGLLLVLSLTVGGEKPIAPLGLWGLAAVCALFRMNLAREEQRVLDLSRVRGFLREDADEVGGRDVLGPEPAVRSLGLLALWVVAGGFLLGWGSPRAADAVAGAVRWLVRGEEVETRPALPEAGDEAPRFEIPFGARSPVPFGARMTRDEFVHRLEEEDNLALLHRRTDGAVDEPDLFVRVAVFDHLSADMRWIRARASRRELEDAEDGTADGRVTTGRGAPSGVEREYLVPPGGDLALPVVVQPVSIGLTRVIGDGAGNLARLREDAKGPYRVVSTDRWWTRPLAEAGEVESAPPEFLRLPTGMDREELRGLVRDAVLTCGTRAERVEAVVRWLRRQCVRHEADRAVVPDGEAEEAPIAFDPIGFLVDRRWGRNIDFATALALLLRAEGIPCRLATGYREGVERPDADFRIYRSWHAFAWVEVPFEDWGWTPVDATPESLAGLSEVALGEVFKAPPEERRAVAEAELEEARRPSLIRRIIDRMDGWISSLLPGAPDSSGVGRAISWLLILLGLGLLIRAMVALAERTVRLTTRRRGREDRAGPAVPFYDRLVRLLARHGLRRRRSETPVEFARGVVDLWGPDYSDVVRLTNAFCAHRYGLRPIPNENEKSYLGRVAALETRLRRRREQSRHRMRGVAAVSMLLFVLVAAPAARGREEPADLVERLGSGVPATREAAAAKLVTEGRGAVPALLEAIGGASAEPVPEEEVLALIRKLDSDSFREREAATEALVALGERARNALEETARSGSPEARQRARRALARLPDAAPDEDAEVRSARIRLRLALRVLSRVGGPAEIEPVAVAATLDPRLGEGAIRTLARLAGGDPGPLEPLLARPDADLRLIATRALAELPGEGARPRLLRLLADPDERVRGRARRALVTASVIERTDRARLLLDARDEAAAEEVLRGVLRDCPGYAEAGLLLAERYLELGREREALALAESLSAGRAVRERLAARALAGTGDTDAALARLHDAAAAEPDRVESLVLAARIALRAEPPRNGRAIEALRTAAGRAPVDPRVWQELGGVLSRFSRTREEAERCFLKAAVLRAGNGDDD